jgi:hypothetical protein
MTEFGKLEIERIEQVRTTEHGTSVVLGLSVKGGDKCEIDIPVGHFQGLMTSLLLAGGFAYRQQLTLLGSDEAVRNTMGVPRFAPTNFLALRGKEDRTGEDLVLLRLEQDGAPVVDVILSFAGAQQIANGLQTELSKGPLASDAPRQRP